MYYSANGKLIIKEKFSNNKKIIESLDTSIEWIKHDDTLCTDTGDWEYWHPSEEHKHKLETAKYDCILNPKCTGIAMKAKADDIEYFYLCNQSSEIWKPDKYKSEYVLEKKISKNQFIPEGNLTPPEQTESIYTTDYTALLEVPKLLRYYTYKGFDPSKNINLDGIPLFPITKSNRINFYSMLVNGEEIIYLRPSGGFSVFSHVKFLRKYIGIEDNDYDKYGRNNQIIYYLPNNIYLHCVESKNNNKKNVGKVFQIPKGTKVDCDWENMNFYLIDLPLLLDDYVKFGFEPEDSKWSEWSECDKKCSIIKQIGKQTRTCESPKYGGLEKECIGDNQKDCNIKPCPINGNWSEWSDCNKDCGPGKQTRICNNPAPKHEGIDCIGNNQKDCNMKPCPEKKGSGLSGNVIFIIAVIVIYLLINKSRFNKNK